MAFAQLGDGAIDLVQHRRADVVANSAPLGAWNTAKQLGRGVHTTTFDDRDDVGDGIAVRSGKGFRELFRMPLRPGAQEPGLIGKPFLSVTLEALHSARSNLATVINAASARPWSLFLANSTCCEGNSWSALCLAASLSLPGRRN